MNIPAIEGGKSTRNEFLPFAKPYISNKEIDEVVSTLKSGWLTTGPKTKEFEKKFANYIGAKFAVAVNSCTSALHLSLLCAGVKKNDEVITSPYTFIATANTILYCGAIPKFVDINPNTGNIDVHKISSKIKSRTRVLLPVHFGGLPCDMKEILHIAKNKKVTVVEDAAHSLSSQYNGKKIGVFGKFTCFSFYVTKNITTGEGGMITFDDERFQKDLRILSLHGMSQDAWNRYSKEGSWYYEVVRLGYKYNMTDINASIGLHQLENAEKFLKIRTKIAKQYNEAFKNLDGILPLSGVTDNSKHSWHLYVIRLDNKVLKINRNKFAQALIKENVGISVHFIPVHLHPFYRKRFNLKRGDFPEAEKLYDSAISLPIYPKMTESQIYDVISAVKKLVQYYKR
ncbi:MAG: DegT/DnrJ/EryC1/StrS family aminotransferase [Candidatus Firestonebacteria bacterium]